MNAPARGGAILTVKVTAGARRTALAGMHAGSLKVLVTAAPEKGKANQAVLSILAAKLGVAKSRLEIIAGHTSATKRIRVALWSQETLEAAIDRLLKGS